MSTYKYMAIELARYNRWQNGVLLGLCDDAGEAFLVKDRGMFFSSVLGTLNHILHVDNVLLAYIHSGVPPESFDPKTRVHDSYDGLRAARLLLDDEIQHLMDDAPEPWFDETFEFFSSDLKRERRRPRALFITQMFNHQTHHRAQITAVMHQLGMDYGSTDMPYNPLSQS